jgi:Flp pilus assembly protein TadG
MNFFSRDRRGSVAIIFALAVFAFVFALGMGVDYELAAMRRAKLNAIADAAALAALTPEMMKKSIPEATEQAETFFNAQAANVLGVKYDSSQLQVNVGPPDSLVRTATVSYTADSKTAFSGILKKPYIEIGGTSTATASVPPNINFYLMLDNSPSMAIAATQNDINTMVGLTSKQGGCAFACHQTNPSTDKLGNPGGPTQDNYALARSNNVTLRIDLVIEAVQKLMAKAQTTAAQMGTQYHMAAYTFNVAPAVVVPLTSDLMSAASQAGNIQVLPVYSNNYLQQGNQNYDADTIFDAAFSKLNSDMPDPGSGTEGNPAQEVLFIVTDGVGVQIVGPGGARKYTPFGATGASWCQSIKNRGIRIAILYTTYLPLPTNSWYNSNVAPIQPSIDTTAQTCASAGLYFKVDIGGDIDAAMIALFQAAISPSHLTQ